MNSAILDCNVVLQAIIGSMSAASYRTVTACLDGDFRLVVSGEVLQEYFDVLTLPRLRSQHRFSLSQILSYLDVLVADCDRVQVTRSVSPRLTRDITDAKFLALAEVSNANYLVTNDRRHLLPLKRHGHTRIVVPAQFLKLIRS